MKIYSMTATFGKLERATLELKPGLNILHAPNEWGKSTWCAFLVAMLYGIETRTRTTKNILTEKNRYAPWSGSPMSGRIDLNWNGRDITIERSSKRSGVMNEFRAYETETGLPVCELRPDNCGQLLLGVEKSVFLRAGFLRLTDLPVTQDDALRRRLNALVTTGDESDTADTLAKKLHALKNACKSNRANGQLPEAEAQRAKLEAALARLKELEDESRHIQQRQQALEAYGAQLKNHQAALEYEKHRQFGEKIAQARARAALTLQQLEAAQARCAALPQADEAEKMLLRLDQLQSELTTVQMDAQLLPEPPKAPQLHSAFRDAEHVDIAKSAAMEEGVYAQAVKERDQKKPMLLSILIAIASLGLMLIPHWVGMLLAVLGFAAGIVAFSGNLAARKRAAATAAALEDRYRPLAPGTWVEAARAAQAEIARYREESAAAEAERAAMAQRVKALKEECDAITGGAPLGQCRQKWLDIQSSWLSLSDARKDHDRAQQMAQALGDSHSAPAPAPLPDSLTYSEAETARLLSDCGRELRQLQEHLGHCRGSMSALGSEAALQQQLAAVNSRIHALQEMLEALEIAQQTLDRATQELQRRFAPQISQRAQELFGKLTGGRYNRLSLDDELTVYTGAAEETTTYDARWRSDGTADQLYLALRLAVSEVLTPDAPLVLDDALVRFDDDRLRRALEVLGQAAETKQVLLFTCQKREAAVLSESEAAL